MWAKATWTDEEKKARSSTARAAAMSSVGIRPLAGYQRPIREMIATFSVTTVSSTLSAGTRACGLIARYSGVLCSPLARLTR